MSKREKPDRFYQGVCSALAVVAGFDEETIWRAIVLNNDGYAVLRAVSKRNGNLRMDGFTRYKPEASQ